MLKRELGLWGATLTGLGSMIGTGLFVSLGIATDLAGPWVLIALILAAAIALCNGLSSAQLAASHPVSGGTYEYGYRYLSPLSALQRGGCFYWPNRLLQPLLPLALWPISSNGSA